VSVTERQKLIFRVARLARMCAGAFARLRARMQYPLIADRAQAERLAQEFVAAHKEAAR